MNVRTQDKIFSVVCVILFIIAMMVSTAAHATKPQPPPDPNQEQNQGQDQHQGQGQHQGQAQKVITKTTVDGPDIDFVGPEIEIEGDTFTVEGDTETWDIPSNSAYAPNGFSMMRCSEILGAGYTNANGSGSVGLPVPRWLSGKIKDCESIADSIWLAELGLIRASIEARCGTRSMRSRFGGKGKKDAQIEACVSHLIDPYKEMAEMQSLQDNNEGLKRENVMLERENIKLKNEVGGCRLKEACGK